ncbi:hypothetical protein Gasu_03110 isoform 2 [Galdieria sulphuraria]|uniref:Uncharacterized protein n=1 Tax=Galdieria sulphuraria TaxID=130081 RepID=M2XQM6_GALSU|nr:hypothetical protein Gasu_03110 isoform 2 [Galdieria sulphuraria]EME32537.1 hypothetical protein isoform 2 [Galdieria sulphuraria]|eukprot:XP_005709057.1 hypothetical protein isoform 2 [Galdieria sulphuraria]
MERQAMNLILSRPFCLLCFGPKGNYFPFQASKEELCELIFNAPTLPLWSNGYSSEEHKLTVSDILRLLRPSLPELCDATTFHCFSQCLLLTRKDHFFAIILRDRLLLFVHNSHSSISSILQEALQSLQYSEDGNSKDPCGFCWLALSSLIVCQAEDLKGVFEELQQQNTELLHRVKSVTDFIHYKDIVLQRESLQRLWMELKDFEQILLRILKMAHSVDSFFNPTVVSSMHAILRIMDQMASHIHQRVEVSNQTEHWLMMESDAVQSQLLSFDVPLTFSAACFLLCFLFFAFTGMNTGIPIYSSSHAIDYWIGMVLIVWS